MKKRPADTPLATDAATVKTSKQRTIDALIAASPSVLLLRDGELVLYRRTRSLLYQCRFKLADGKWHRFSTRRASLENAIAAACDMYDEARYRERLGLPDVLKRYNVKLRDADFQYNKYEKMNGLRGTGKAKYKTDSLRRTNQRAQHLYERALEYCRSY